MLAMLYKLIWIGELLCGEYKFLRVRLSSAHAQYDNNYMFWSEIITETTDVF